MRQIFWSLSLLFCHSSDKLSLKW